MGSEYRVCFATLRSQVIFFDSKDYSGGSQDFPVTLPATGCTPCTELNYVRTNSWESYVSSGGSAIILFDGHGCSGKTSGRVPANQGVIQGTLSNSMDSFMLCA
ncbi:hypothetical protein WJX77_001749 [Trebouxia sp. C0004]